MTIDKKLIHFKTWNNFISQGVGSEANITTPTSGSEETRDAIYGQIKGTSIVFIKDVSKIWTHGQVYDGSAPNTQDLGTKVYPIYSKDALGVESLTPDQQNANKEAFDVLTAGTPAVFMLAEVGITSTSAILVNNNLASFVFALTSVFTNEAELTNLTVMISSDGSISTEGINTIRVSEKEETYSLYAKYGASITEEQQEINKITFNACLAYFEENTKSPVVFYENDPNFPLVLIGGDFAHSEFYFTMKASIGVEEGQELYASASITLFSDGSSTVSNIDNYAVPTTAKVEEMLATKQDTLVSGTNIATINNQSLLEGGNITIESGTDITVDSELSEESENPVQNKVITQVITDIENRLSELTNYDDTIKKSVQDLQTALDSLINGGTTEAIDSINEILAFLSTIADTETLAGMFANLQELVTPLYINIGINFPQTTTSGTFSELNVTSTDVFEAAQNKKAIWIVDSLGTAYQCTVTITKEGDSNGVMIKAFTHTSDGSLATIAIMFVENSSVAIWRSSYTSVQEKLESGTNIKTINGDSILGEGDILLNASPEIYIGTEAPTDENILVWYDTNENGESTSIDSEVSETSTNAIENQAITKYVNEQIIALETRLKEYVDQKINEAITAVLNTEV